MFVLTRDVQIWQISQKLRDEIGSLGGKILHSMLRDHIGLNSNMISIAFITHGSPLLDKTHSIFFVNWLLENQSVIIHAQAKELLPLNWCGP